MLAVGATAVATGVRHQALLATRVAARQHAQRQRAAATTLHGAQGLAVAGQDRTLVLVQEVRLKALDDGGQRNHVTAPQCRVKLFIKVLMRTLAWVLVWLVRWV